MSFTKYPKNWHSNGYGWHSSAALTYGKRDDASSGVSSMVDGATPFSDNGSSAANIGELNSDIYFSANANKSNA